MKKIVLIAAMLFGIMGISNSQISESVTDASYLNLNKPERMEWFKGLGFGMFIHFSFDSQLGVVISHSMVGASEDYLNRFVNELPKSFNPKDFNPAEIASLAKLAGMKYIVFTTKHHSGFCMWDTKTTDFKITNTPYNKDLLSEYVKAVKEEGLAVGFYYSPEDFNFLYKNKQVITRDLSQPLPADVMKKYLAFLEMQCSELMTGYGPVDVVFLDGGEGPLQEKCKEVVWKLQPNVVITRGAIKTPEQRVAGVISHEPWEACITMGTQWAFKPTNEEYKSAARLIEILIETRAKGGNLLLNIGPKPNGQVPLEQEYNLMEMAAWNFINHEAVTNVSPWIVANEGDIWYTYKPQEKTLYAILTKNPDWPRGARKEFILQSIKAGPKTKIEVLGQTGKVVEYQPATDGTTRFEQQEQGLMVSCVRAQRIYNNHQWHNPIILKITNAEPALKPPVVQTLDAEINANGVHFKGELLDPGDGRSLKGGFQYRKYPGFVEELYIEEWKETPLMDISKGNFSVIPDLIKGNTVYQVRSFVEHPKLRVYGEILNIKY